MRRPDCIAYPDCLTTAAAVDAADLACHSCSRYDPSDSLVLYHHEIDGILSLLLALEDESEQAHT